MPLYDWRCERGHLFEAFETDIEREKMDCRMCRCPASRVWISRSKFRREAQAFVPPVVFRKAGATDGKDLYRFPGRFDEQAPSGYERVELRTVSEIRKFENEYGGIQKKVHQAYQEIEEAYNRVSRKDSINQLRNQVGSLSGPLRFAAEQAIARYDRRSFSDRARRFDPGFSVEAFSYDSSNRDRCDDPQYSMDRQRR